MSKNYIDLFYKEAQSFNSRKDLRVVPDLRDSLIRGPGSPLPTPIGMYQIASNKFIRFIAGAGILLNFKSVGKFFFNAFAGLFKLKTDRLKRGIDKILKSNYNGSVVSGEGSLGDFLTENGIATNVTDTFQEATNAMEEAKGQYSGIFKNASFNNKSTIVVFAEDNDEKFKDPNKFKKLFDVGSIVDSGLNKNQQYFSMPEFVLGWCGYASKFLENVPSENLKEGNTSEFSELVKKAGSLAEKALAEANETYKKILEADEKLSKEAIFSKKYTGKQGITINKTDNVRMADESSKNYYKHALKDVTGDPLMKEFYSGMADFYSEKKAMNDSRKRKDLFDFFLDESDITSSSHSESVMVSKSLGEGGLVENGHQSKKKHVDVARSNPSGNFKNK